MLRVFRSVKKKIRRRCFRMSLMLWKWDKNNQKIKKIYTDWANHFLERAGRKLMITDLQVDIASGVVLSQVIESVLDEKVQDINVHPRTSKQMIDNIDKCLRCLAGQGVNTEGLNSKDIREGNLKAVLGLFFALSRFKQLQQQEEKAKQEQQKQQQPPKKTSQKTQRIQQQPKTQLQASRQKSPQPPQRTAQQRAQQRQRLSQNQAHQYSPYQTHSSASSTGVPRAPQSQASQRQSATKQYNATRQSRATGPVTATTNASSKASTTQLNTSRTNSPRQSRQSNLGAPQRRQGTSTSSLSSSSSRNSSSDMSSRIPTPNKIPRGPPSSQSSGLPRSSAAADKMKGRELPTPSDNSHGNPPSVPVRRESRLKSPSSGKGDSSNASRLAQQGPQKSKSAASYGKPGATSPGKDGKGSVLTKLFRGKDEPGLEKPKSLNVSGQKVTTPKGDAKTKAHARGKAQKLRSPSSSSSRDRAPPPPPRDIPLKDQASKSRPVTLQNTTQDEESGMKKINSSSSIATSGSNNSSGAPSTSTSPGSSLGSSSPKNALRKLGRAFGSGPKSSKKKEPDKKPPKQPYGRHSPDGQGASADEATRFEMTRTKSDLVKTGSKLVPPKSAVSSKQQSALSKVKPVQSVHGGTSPPDGKSKHVGGKGGIPKPGSSAGKSGLKLKTPSSYQTYPKNNEQVVQRREKPVDRNSFNRGSGIYSTFPGPGMPRTSVEAKGMSPQTSPTKSSHRKAGSPDKIHRNVRTPTSSPSRSSANTATVAPFNYNGSLPPCKDSREVSLTNSEHSSGTPIHSQISVSSDNSDISVVYKPKDSDDLCTTVYKNNQAVTTFGTPTLPRAMKGYDNMQPSAQEVTIMNIQTVNQPSPRGSPARSVKETTFGATKETTFGDNVTTQVRTQKAMSECSASPCNSPRVSRSSIGGYMQPGALSNVPYPGFSGHSHSDGTASLTDAFPPYRAHNNGNGPQRFQTPSFNNPKLFTPSIRRATASRGCVNENYMERDLEDEMDDVITDHLSAGYMSDGDMLHRNAGLGDIASGYMSEGGGLWGSSSRRMNKIANFDGMAAVREYLQRTVNLSDEESLDDDSSSLSSGISDTIAEISTDDNITGSGSISCSSSSNNLCKKGHHHIEDGHSPGSSCRNSCDCDSNKLEIYGETVNIDDPIETSTPNRHGRKGHLSGDRTDSPSRKKSGKSKKKSEHNHPPPEEGLDDMNGYPGIPTRNGVLPPNWQRSLDRLQVKEGKKMHDGAVVSRSSRTVLKYENGSGTLEKIKSIRNGQIHETGSNPDLRKGAGPRNQFSSFGYRRAGQQQQQTQVSPPGASSGKSSMTKSGSFGFSQKGAGITKGARSPPGSDGKGKGMARPPRTASSPPDSRVDRKSPQETKSSIAQRAKMDRSMSADRGKADHNANTEAWSMGRYQPPAVGSDPNTPVKSRSAMQKSIPQTASIKQMFGSRGSKDMSSPSSDTIISNPHATLKESLMSPPSSRQSIHSTSLHHTVPLASRRASSGLSVDLSFNKTPFSDSLRYSGYMSDSYTSVNRDSGLGSLHSDMGSYKSGAELMGSLRRSESGSLESLDSNNSTSMSITSRATSERYGLTSPPTTVQRSNSLRSTLSDKPMSYAVTSKDLDETAWMQNKYTEGAGPLSPTGSSASQPPAQFFAMAAALGQMAGPNSNMVRSSSMSGPSYNGDYGPLPRMRNSSVSLDERQRMALSVGVFSTPSEEFHGSSQSLVSNNSSIYSTPEERATMEIRRLKQELEREQERVGNLSTQLSSNAHVVAAFEQSLSNMTNRLQMLTCNADQKDSELQELRDRIEQLKVQSSHVTGNSSVILPGESSTLPRKLSSLSKDSQANYSFHATTNGNAYPPYYPPAFTRNSPFNSSWANAGSSPEVRIHRQTSSDSMSSLASMTSMSSVGSAATDSEVTDKKNKKKKNWLRSSFRAAFSRKKKQSGTTTDVEDLESNASFPSNSSYSPTQSQMKTSASTSAIYDAQQSQETITELRRELRDKESKITDIKLESLTSQHQLDQLKETVNKMKSEMMSLKQENDRLQRQMSTNTRRSQETASSQASLSSLGSSKRLSRDSLDRHRLSMGSEHGSLDILLDDNSGMTNNSQRIIVTVAFATLADAPKTEGSTAKRNEVMIGTIGISSKTNWDTLDSVVKRIFKEYVLRIDPVTNLGLSAESVCKYIVGEITRTKDADPPELLPCGYLVGDNTSIQIHVKGVQQNSCDSLVFESLIPKPILQRYISLLMEHKRIILCGPSGTGKTYLAHKLAEHIVQRAGKEPNEGAIATFNVDHKTSKELRQYLAHIADQCEANSLDLPTVIILDNLHHVGSLGDVFNGFLSYRYHKCPYIIGTMNQATCSSTNLQLHHNFRWVLCANHMEPVKGFLGRYLRRKLVETEISENMRNNDLNKITDWIPKVWHHLNKFLETHNSSDVTIGPRLFLSCPVDLAGSQVWFTDLWNYSIVPYLLEAVREGLQLYGRKGSWEDPADWVVDSYPWLPSSSQDWPSLLRLRPEDVGFDGYNIQTAGTKGSQSGAQSDVEGDPLFNMLMRLQEAANYTENQSCESDTNSLDSVGMSNEDLSQDIVT